MVARPAGCRACPDLVKIASRGPQAAGAGLQGAARPARGREWHRPNSPRAWAGIEDWCRTGALSTQGSAKHGQQDRALQMLCCPLPVARPSRRHRRAAHRRSAPPGSSSSSGAPAHMLLTRALAPEQGLHTMSSTIHSPSNPLGECGAARPLLRPPRHDVLPPAALQAAASEQTAGRRFRAACRIALAQRLIPVSACREHWHARRAPGSSTW